MADVNTEQRSRDMGMYSEQLAGRTQQTFFSAEEGERYLYPGACEVDFDKRADFDAQEIFNNLNGELAIQPVNVGFAAFYESLGRVDLMSNHSDEKPVFISGKQVRATLQAGEQVDTRIMRPSTSQILAAAMKQD